MSASFLVPQTYKGHSRPSRKLLKDSAATAEEEKRGKYIRGRLWCKGAHRNCCTKCFQAAYVLAIVRTNRLDLLGEHPKLIAVHEEVLKEGMTTAAVRR